MGPYLVAPGGEREGRVRQDQVEPLDDLLTGPCMTVLGVGLTLAVNAAIGSGVLFNSCNFILDQVEN